MPTFKIITEEEQWNAKSAGSKMVLGCTHRQMNRMDAIDLFAFMPTEIKEIIAKKYEKAYVKKIINKFKDTAWLGVGGQSCWNALAGCETASKEYCRKHKLALSYNGNNASNGWSPTRTLTYCLDIGQVRAMMIVFQHFGRDVPKASKLSKEWKKKGICWEMVRDNWDEADRNLFIIAKNISGSLGVFWEEIHKAYTGPMEYLFIKKRVAEALISIHGGGPWGGKNYGER